MPNTVALAKNTSNNKYQSLSVDASGKLLVADSQVNLNSDTLEAKLDSVITKQSDGTQITKIMGSEDGSTTGTQRQVHLDGSGNVLTSIVSTVNTAPANSVNSGITDDPANSVSVGMRGRTDVSLANTEKFVKVSSAGRLEVDVNSMSGGGDASAANQVLTNSKLDDIKTAVEILDNTVSGNELQCDIVSSALPTGAATLAKQDEIKDKIVLPTTLGQKANSNCLATCRSTTTGAYDLSAKTDPATAGTSTKLHCDSNGNLIISNTQNIGVKLEDLSSTLNADLSNHSRTIAVGLRCRTDITDHSSGKFLLCDSAGKLSVNNNAITTGADWLSSASISNGAYSDALDINNASAVQIFGSSTTNVSGGLQIFGGNANTGTSDFFPLHNQIDITTPLSLTQNQVGVNNFQYGYLKNPPRYLRIYNGSGSSATLTLKVSSQ